MSKLSGFKKGIFIFATISFITFVLIFVFSGDYQKTIESLDNIKTPYLFFALIIMFVAVFFDTLMVRTIMRMLEESIGIKTAFNVVLGSEFLCAITPFQSGGQPLQVYILHKDGIGVGKSVLFSFIKTAFQISFFFFPAIVVLVFYPELFTPSLLPLFIYGFLLFGYFITMTFLTIFKKKLLKRILYRGVIFMKRFRKFREKGSRHHMRVLRNLLREFEIFNTHLMDMFKNKKRYILLSLLYTTISWTLKFSVAIVVFYGLGASIDIFKGVIFQFVSNFLNFFSPTPGSSATAEYAAVKIFTHPLVKLSDHSVIPLFTIIWRFLSYYTIVITGGIIVIKIFKLKPEDLKKSETEIEESLKSYNE